MTAHTVPSVARTALSATVHCLTGCAIGEVLGMVTGTALHLSNHVTVVIRSCWRSFSATASRYGRSYSRV